MSAKMDSHVYFMLFFNQRPEIIELLIKNKANVNAKDLCGQTPLMPACYLANYDIVKMLIDNGADLNAQDIDGNNALFFALQKS